MRCSLILPTVLSRPFDTGNNDSGVSLDNFDNQSVNRKSFGIGTGWASVSRRKGTARTILFPAPIKMCTEQTYFPVTATIDV